MADVLVLVSELNVLFTVKVTFIFVMSFFSLCLSDNVDS